MSEYRPGAHSVFEIRLHLVWVTKDHKPVLVGPIGLRVRELTREVRGALDVPIREGHIGEDRVHLQEFAPPRKQFWGRHLWVRGYFCDRSGDVTDEVVAAYIANHGKPGPGGFRVEHEGP